MKRALMYLRVSTDKQAEKGLSIPAQKERCLKYAKDNGYEVNEETDIYIDGGISGKTDDRMAFRKMSERLKTDTDVVAIVAYDISRIFRNGLEYFKYRGVLENNNQKILSVSENISDDGNPANFLIEWMLAGVHDFRSRQDGQKIKMGILQKVKEGGWPTIAPFGYKNVRDGRGSDKDHRWIEINESEAVWVKKVFNMYATGNYSLHKLAQTLSKEGFPMRTSKKLHQGFLHRILNNPACLGKIPFQGKVYDGKHEPLIEQSLYQRNQDILFEHGKGADRSQKHRFPLKGILFCGVCGSKYTGEQHIIKNGNTVRYLRCMKNIKGERVECNERYFQEGHISTQFGDLFKSIQLPDSITERLRDRIKKIFKNEQELYEKSRKSILVQLETIKRQKKSLVLKFIDKATTVSDEELFATIKTDLENKEVLLNQQLNQVEGNMTKALKVIEISLVLANNCYRAYNKATPELRGLLAKAFFERITVRNGQIVSATLNAPLDYLCRNRAKNSTLFKLNCRGGGGVY